MERLKILRNYLTTTNNSSIQQPVASPPSSPSSESPPHSPGSSATPIHRASSSSSSDETATAVSANKPTTTTTTSTTPPLTPTQPATTPSSSSAPSLPSQAAAATVADDSTELRWLNSRMKSFNDSTKRITSLLQFRTSTTNPKTPPSPPESIPLADFSKSHNRKGQFFRSKSHHASHKKHSKKSSESAGKEEPDGHESEPDEHNRTLTKKKILSDERISNEFILKTLNHDLDVLLAYFLPDFNQSSGSSTSFLDTSIVTGDVYYQLTNHTKQLLARCTALARQVEESLPNYDYNGIKVNGYRSLTRTYYSCLRRLLIVVHELNEKKSRRLYLRLLSTNLKDYQSWVKLLEKYELILDMCLEMQRVNKAAQQKNAGEIDLPWSLDNGSSFLFVHSSQFVNTALEERLFQLSSQIDVFFGKVCGFQYCESLQLPLTGCAIALASYNDGFEMFTPTSSVSSPRASSPSTSGIGSSINAASVFSSFNIPSTPNTTAPPAIGASNPNGNSTNTMTTQTSATSNGSNGSQQMSISSAIGKAAMSVMSSTKYIMDPELRARKMSHIMRRANVEFCKEFWQLTETSVVQMGSNLVNPKTAINVVKAINLSKTLRLPKVEQKETSKGQKPVFSVDEEDPSASRKSSNSSPNTTTPKEPEFADIHPPKTTTTTSNGASNETVHVRVISHELRRGMEELDHLKTVDYAVSSHGYNQSNLASHTSSSSIKEPSSCLILHAHGGGFIAQSSRSHEIYLRPWARELKVPIVSIDYSLAPENPFPKASEECFYVYCWCLLNKEALGWTGEKIICVGDSAGGVLVTNIVQRAIMAGIRIPDALVPIYAPFLSTFSLSPSRILAIMDPLLNFGILWRCLAAYCGINFQIESENFKQILNLNEAASNVTMASNVKKSSLARLSNRSASSKQGSIDSTTLEGSTTVAAANEEPSLKSDDASSTSEVFTALNLDSDKERLIKLYEIMGESIFLVEKLRNHETPYDPCISPLLSDDSILAKFPRTCLISTSLDPLLDDSIEFENKLKRLNVPNHNLIIFNNLNHGFLNFTGVSKDCRRASKVVVSEVIKAMIDGSPITDLVIDTSDPFIDDNIEMLKRLERADVNVDAFFVDNGSPHGFLNMQTLTDETHEAFVEVIALLKDLIKEICKDLPRSNDPNNNSIANNKNSQTSINGSTNTQ